MTTASPITDIHAAERKAVKQIEQTKLAGEKKILESRENEDKKLAKLEEELRASAKDKFEEAKAAAGKEADEKLRSGKTNDESMIQAARNKSAGAVQEGVKAFMSHIGL